eukprot:tig00021439_g21471.t1
MIFTSVALAAGTEHTCTATQTDPSGTSGASAAVTFTTAAASAAPVAPTITAPTAGIDKPRDADGKVEFTLTVVNTATKAAVTCTPKGAAALAAVEATFTAGVTTATVKRLAIVVALAAGTEHTCTATQTDPSGTSGASAAVTFTTAAASAAPVAPTITAPTAGIDKPRDADGKVEFTLTVVNTATKAAVTCTPKGAAALAAVEATFTAGVTTATVKVALAAGTEHTCTATQTDPSGTSGASAAVTFTTAAASAAPVAPTITAPTAGIDKPRDADGKVEFTLTVVNTATKAAVTCTPKGAAALAAVEATFTAGVTTATVKVRPPRAPGLELDRELLAPS